MLLPILVFAIVYVFIATEWLDKTVAALLGAAAMIILHCLSYDKALEAIDLNVIFVLIGMMIIVNVLSSTGLFEWLSIKIAQVSKGNALVIMLALLLMTAFLSAVLDNVTTVILVAPITILLTQILEVPTVPFLIMEALFSNIGGTATLVGDPPNILIGSQTSLSFNDFILNLTPVILIVLAVSCAMVYFHQRKTMKSRPAARERIERSRPERAILKPMVMKRGLAVFGLVMIGFLLGRLLGIEPGIVALAGGMLMIPVCKVDLHKALQGVEWNTILFFVGLFMMVAGLEEHGVFEALGQRILQVSDGNLLMTALLILWFSAVASAIVDNIPLVMAMIPLVLGIVPVFAKQMGIEADPVLTHTLIAAPLLWSLALGACLGGNGTLVGASANVVIAQIANRNNCPISFKRFTQYGVPYMVVSLVICTGYIYLRYFAFVAHPAPSEAKLAPAAPPSIEQVTAQVGSLPRS